MGLKLVATQDRFLELFALPSKMHDEALLRATPEGISMCLLDGGMVTMISMAAKADAFSAFEYDGPAEGESFPLSLESVAEFVKRVPKVAKGCDVKMSIGFDDANKVVMQAGRLRASFKLLGDAPSKVVRPDLAKLGLLCTVTLQTSELKVLTEVVSDLAEGAQVRFAVEGGKLALVAGDKQGEHEATITLEGEVVPMPGPEGPMDIGQTMTLVNPDQLKDICSALPDRPIDLHIGYNRPLVMSYQDPVLEVMALLAPLIERD